MVYSELSLRRTPLGPTQTFRLREVSPYREFRYSNMTEKWRAGTNTKCPSYRGVRLIELTDALTVFRIRPLTAQKIRHTPRGGAYRGVSFTPGFLFQTTKEVMPFECLCRTSFALYVMSVRIREQS